MSNPTAIRTLEEIQALPVGSVCVDPYDARGDAPVVLCRSRWGWAILGELNERVWHDQEVLEQSGGRLLAVYRPVVEGDNPRG